MIRPEARMPPIEASDLDTELEVLHLGGPQTTVVVRKPFIDPGKEILKK